MITHDQPGTSEAVRAAARELDYDRYLAALLAPARARDGLLALAAFHGEIARIPRTVREPGVGDIRLQWWRDALATPAAIATGNPVADAVRAQALPVDTLVAMIDAYGVLLEAGALTTGAAVDAHAAATQGAMLLLAAQIVGCAHPATHPLLHAAGQAEGRVQLLRALPGLVAKGHNPFGDADVAARVPPLLRQAKAELARARQLAMAAPATILPVILPLALLEPYLAALEGPGSHVADRRADISALTRAWRLLKASALGRV
jgi:phytoene synthase